MISLASIFVFGLLPDSPGKTLIGRAIVRGLINRGLDMGVFKPRSGHNYWYQYDTFLICREKGQLFCTDIIKLREASGNGDLPYELLNPIDALMSPLKIDRYLPKRSWSQFFINNYQNFSHLVMERYTIYDSGIVNTICINPAKLKELIFSDRVFVNNVIDKADETIVINCLEEWNRVYNTLSTKSIMSCYLRIRDKYENIVVEGFNDAVCPDPNLSYDLIIGVAPGVALFYEPERFSQVIKFMGELGKNPLSLRAENILEYLKEIEAVKIPPLSSEEKKDTDLLSQKLSPIVDRVEDRFEKGNHQIVSKN